MIVRPLFDAASSTFTYLVFEPTTKHAVLIDPVYEQHARDGALIHELELTLDFTIETHCHADHVTGAWLMKQTLGSKIALAKVYGAANVDMPLEHGSTIRFGHEVLSVRATPGHTVGCVSLVDSARSMVFTGDALLVRGAGRTDFQGGDPHALFLSIHEQLFTLPDDCIVYPGHEYEGRMTTTVGEERRFNPRIGGGAREEDFVGYMHNLGLPHPKQIAIAVPANMRCGEPEAFPEGYAVWGPVTVTYAGVQEVAPEWVARHRHDVHIVDVRSAAEFDGELGHIAGARLLPLDELRKRAAEVAADKPVVVVCQTGKRSTIATAILRKAGVSRVANLAGGMVRWRELGLPS
jgi:glyoxylase-like metal-dependent hydrolase (beta-lactamase superfamily II)/rhodanese-related sulfurtransferase